MLAEKVLHSLYCVISFMEIEFLIPLYILSSVVVNNQMKAVEGIFKKCYIFGECLKI